MSYRIKSKKVATIRIAGPDKKGIIAKITTFLFQNSCNIEDIDQRVLDDYLIMNMQVDITQIASRLKKFNKDLQTAAQEVGAEAYFRPLEKSKLKRVALLASKEKHCLVDLLEKFKKKSLKGEAVIVIANHPDLEKIAKRYKVDFVYIPSSNKKKHEESVLKKLKEYHVDLIVLARYMQILSPYFVFRYEGRIINIHPSLLPAFPGPRPYRQAYEKGVELIGVTAHFVTTDLDEGPIITQEATRINKNKDDLESIIEKGQKLETKVLSKAVKLFLEDRLSLRRGKVINSKKTHDLNEKTSNFYR